jgi:hypothetical protein
MPLLIGTPLIFVSLWIIANDPTVRTWRRRMRLEAGLRRPAEEMPLEEVIAILPEEHSGNSQRHNRRRAGGRIKSSFNGKPSYNKRQKRKTR